MAGDDQSNTPRNNLRQALGDAGRSLRRMRRSLLESVAAAEVTFQRAIPSKTREALQAASDEDPAAATPSPVEPVRAVAASEAPASDASASVPETPPRRRSGPQPVPIVDAPASPPSPPMRTRPTPLPKRMPVRAQPTPKRRVSEQPEHLRASTKVPVRPVLPPPSGQGAAVDRVVRALVLKIFPPDGKSPKGMTIPGMRDKVFDALGGRVSDDAIYKAVNYLGRSNNK
jgi:hypothetical protein